MTESMPESFVRSDGVNIWTIRAGEGSPAVMLCNGGAGCFSYSYNEILKCRFMKRQ